MVDYKLKLFKEGIKKGKIKGRLKNKKEYGYEDDQKKLEGY